MTPTSQVAIAGLVAALTIGVFGFLVQIWIARAARRAALRQHRHDELIATYSEVGRTMAAGLTLQSRLLVGLIDGTVTEMSAVTTLATDHGLQNGKHPSLLLELHDASDEVVDAYEAWLDLREDALRDSDVALGVEAGINALNQRMLPAIEHFYRVAGEHARRELAPRAN